MITIAFDTLLFSHKLEETGMPREQAEKLAEVQKEIIEAQNQALQETFDKTIATHVATKEDIWKLKQELKKDIHNIDKKIDLTKKEFQGKFTLIYWMNSFILALLVAVALKLFL